MEVQKSFKDNNEAGVLYIVGTPIGNLSDLSLRAKEVLGSVQLIAAEDTRHSRKLLTHLGISKPFVSYHKYNQRKQEDRLVQHLEKGESIALVSDAGMPSISDPGEMLVSRVIKEGFFVIPIPGPVASLSALVASGLPTQPHLFLGFLPRTSKKRKEELLRWRDIQATLLMYESPYRLISMLQDAEEVMGDRDVVISREITKKNEEWVRGRMKKCISFLEHRELKGEYTIVLAPSVEKKEEMKVSDEAILDEIQNYMESGLSRSEAIKKVAQTRNISKNGLYKKVHKIE